MAPFDRDSEGVRWVTSSHRMVKEAAADSKEHSMLNFWSGF
jgi:hypothetical protein